MNATNNTERTRILIVGDHERRGHELTATFPEQQYRVESADSKTSAQQTLANRDFDLVIVVDDGRNDDPLSIVRMVTHAPRPVEVVYVVCQADTKTGLEAVKSGAFNYVVWPADRPVLYPLARRAIETGRMKRELLDLRETVAMSFGFDNIVGISDQMVQLKATAQRLAMTDIAILILGPPGSGKELLAGTIHHHSRRRHRRFVPVDFSSSCESLAAVELFGSEDDNARQEPSRVQGAFERGDGGTIFLGEIDRIPESLQEPLVRFLRESKLPSPAPEARRHVDVRIITSSCLSQDEITADGHVCKPVLDRLSLVTLQLPSLAERLEDIEVLADYFLRRMAVAKDKGPLAISREAIDKLQQHSWPGNVRELENCLQRAAALCRSDCLEAEDIQFVHSEHSSGLRSTPDSSGRKKTDLLASSQRLIIVRALEENNWNFTQTAQELGIGRTTLWRKVKKFRLQRKEPEST